MKLIELALKNLAFRWVSSLLSLLLIALSVALLWLVREIQQQSEVKLKKNLAGIDLVVGAKGSPLQLILSSLYHIDAPTGNIPYSEAERLARHPMVKTSVPLAYGDYCGPYRIVGTSYSYPELYNARLAEGKLWAQPMEACLGADAATKSGLKTGDTFKGQHGDPDSDEQHGEYRVSGVFERTGTVIDQLILCSVSSVWQVHEEPGHEHAGGHGEENREITALLIQYKNKMAALQLPRMVNASSSLQAAAPAIEINRLSYLLNTGSETLRWAALLLLLLATFSIFVQVWMGLRERRKELALLRALGYGTGRIIRLLLLELGLLVVIAYLLGQGVARVFLARFSEELNYGSAYSLEAGNWTLADLWLFALPLGLIGICVLMNARKIDRISMGELLQNP